VPRLASDTATGGLHLSLIHLGDLPGWLGAIGTVAAVSLALYQVSRERAARQADARAAAAEDRRNQARQVNAWYISSPEPRFSTPVMIANLSDAPVFQAVVWFVLAQGTGPRTGEDYKNFDLDVIFQRVQVFLNAPPGSWVVGFPDGWQGMHAQPGAEIAFTDAGGHHWIRRAWGELIEIDTPPIDYYGLPRPVSYSALHAL
jgi:hypothetical protein